MSLAFDADIADLLGPPSIPPPRVVWLRRPAVEARTGLSRSEIYRRMADDTFPKQRTISTRKVVWALHEIDAWLDSYL